MADDDALFKKGMPIRREVLGPDYVDASMARADEFMMSFQRATTAWAWGWAWGDATLDRKTRSLMNLAMLSSSPASRSGVPSPGCGHCIPNGAVTAIPGGVISMPFSRSNLNAATSMSGAF